MLLNLHVNANNVRKIKILLNEFTNVVMISLTFTEITTFLNVQDDVGISNITNFNKMRS